MTVTVTVAVAPAEADSTEVHLGVVVTFDDPMGVGELELADGRVAPFHCTAIADGSRTIAAGTPVAFSLVTAHHGRVEATAIVPLVPPSPATPLRS